MKTPEQVAQEVLNALDLGGVSGEGEPTDCYQLTAALRSGWFDGFDAVEWMVRAIEADRAQRQTDADEAAAWATEVYLNLREPDYDSTESWDNYSLGECAAWAARKALGAPAWEGEGA